jgi:hypothetical protein
MAVATDMSNIAFYTSSNLGTTGSAVPSNERMRIDSSGLVGIGTTTPSSFGGGLVVRKANTAQGVTNATAQFSDAVNSALWVGHTSGATNLVSDAALTFGYTNGTTTTERMRIDSSGNLLVGTTSVFSSGKQCIAFTGGTVQGLNIRNNADNPADTFVGFYNAYGTKVGSITAGGSTTTYNTSSDYRLKENVQPLVNALDKVMALRPVSYTWKSGGEDNGFIAHELQLILPKAVSGEKDAVNEDDTINPQGVDYSKIVATLTAAIQEQQALITALTNRIAVLEAK